ncbi:MAG: DUF6531 domain-containing protein [Fimbriimonas sp.]|nr:DUF6531 domain-containing protein [Fimbriimonas sp.]
MRASRPKAAPALKTTKWSKNLFGSKVDLSVKSATLIPPVAESPGTALPWQPSFPVEGGSENLANANLTLLQSTANWSSIGPSVSFSLIFNSQATNTSGPVGPKWRHSYQISVTSNSTSGTVVYPDGRSVTFSRSGTTYTAPAGFYEVLTQNANGFKLTFKDGSTWNFNTEGRLATIKDQYNNTLALNYTGTNLTSLVDASGRTLTITYTNNRINTVSKFDGTFWSLAYDGGGRLQTVTEPANGPAATTVYGYDFANNVVSRTNKVGKTWQYVYQGNKLSYVQDPMGNYSGQYSPPQAPAPDQNSFSATANSLADPDQLPATYPVGTVATAYVEDAAGYASEYGMDANGTITAVRDGNGNQTNFAYDANRNRTQIVAPDGATTTMVYDIKGNNTSTTDATNRTSTNAYNTLNLVTSSTDSAGKTTSYSYTGYRLNSVTDATSRTTTYAVGTNGLVNSVTDNAGKTTSYLYNAFGENTRITDPLGNQTNFAYVNGDRVSRTDALNRTTNYAYDAWDRLTAVDYPTSADQSFSYDEEGRMLSAVDGTGTRTYTYDDLGRKVGQTDPRGNTVATYDEGGRLLTQTDVTGRLINYAYDGNSRLQQVSDPTTWAQYTYDNRSRVTQTLYSNGVRSLYGYDSSDRISALSHRDASNAIIIGYTASYDSAGRLGNVTENNGSVTSYGYDSAGRLLSENRTGSNPYVSTYTYTNRGQRATAFRSENGVTSHNGSYAYDDDGRLTNVADTVTASGVNGSYSWNDDSTLSSAPKGSSRLGVQYDDEAQISRLKTIGGSAMTDTFEYQYGFDGMRRLSKNLASNLWVWSPCGVSCCAGELLALASSDGGQTWTTSDQQLQAGAMDPVTNGELYLTNILGSKVRLMSSAGVVLSSSLSDSFEVPRDGTFTIGNDELWVSQLTNLLDIDEQSFASFSKQKEKHTKGRPQPRQKPRPRTNPRSLPKPKPGIVKQIGKGLGTGAAIFNGICGLTIIAIADDLQNKSGPPSCKDVCGAITIYKDIVRDSSIIVGIANAVGCETALTLMERMCLCK